MMVPTLISSSMTHSNIASVLSGDSETNGRAGLLKRSISVPGAGEGDTSESENLKNMASGNGSAKSNNGFNGSKVLIPKLDDDETFSKFFTKTVINEKNVEVDDLDVVERSTERLLAGHKKVVQGPKRRQAARNPLKALAARKDLQSEYTEIKSGIAEKELKRIKFEQSECFSTR